MVHRKEGNDLQGAESITIISKRKHVNISASAILYISMKGRNSEVHVISGETYETRVAIDELESRLGNRFLRVCRSCLVSVLAVNKFSKKMELINGEQLDYPIRKKRALNEALTEKRRQIVSSINRSSAPITHEELRRHYMTYESMSFAFADIEIMFSEENNDVDWILRYGNPALSELLKVPLEELTDISLSALFKRKGWNWNCSHERSALYGETLEMVEPDPQSEGFIRKTSFPTFPGHCGVILMDLSQIRYSHNGDEADKALLRYFGVLTE